MRPKEPGPSCPFAAQGPSAPPPRSRQRRGRCLLGTALACFAHPERVCQIVVPVVCGATPCARAWRHAKRERGCLQPEWDVVQMTSAGALTSVTESLSKLVQTLPFIVTLR